MKIYYISLLAVISACILGLILIPEEEYNDWGRQAVMERNRLEKELVEEVDTYIHSVAPKCKLTPEKLIDECNRYGVDLIFVLAQAEIESCFGTKGRAEHTNSVWNVGADDNLTRYNSKKYKSQDSSIEPYLRLLTMNYLVDGKTEADLMRNFVNKRNRRYASSLDYERHLRAKYRYIYRNTNIASLTEELEKNLVKSIRIEF